MRGINHSATKWASVGQVAARQHGVVSRRQLRNLGVSDGSLEKAVSGGRLHPGLRGTFGVGIPPDGEHAHMMAAVLACGSGTVVSHLSAAYLLGLRDRRPAAVEVIAPGQAGRKIDGVRCHHVARPQGSETGACQAIPCTSPARTVVDLAGMLGERTLRGVAETAAVQGTLDVAEIERIMATGRRRGAVLLRRILRDWRPPGLAPERGVEIPDLRSELEARLKALITNAGLPDPHCNRRLDVGEEHFTVDFLWSEQRLVVETDGERFHDNPAAFERDRHRDRVLQLNGYRVIRFTQRQVEREPTALIATIRSMIDNMR